MDNCYRYIKYNSKFYLRLAGLDKCIFLLILHSDLTMRHSENCLRKVNIIMYKSIIDAFDSEILIEKNMSITLFRDEMRSYLIEIVFPTDFWNTLQ